MTPMIKSSSPLSVAVPDVSFALLVIPPMPAGDVFLPDTEIVDWACRRNANL